MLYQTVFFVLTILVGTANAADPTIPAEVIHSETATLTCLPQEAGTPRQQLFVKAVDGKRAGTWASGLRKSVSISPGPHTVTIKYVFVLVSRELNFDLNLLPGHTYNCIGKKEDKDFFHITIQDQDTGETVESSSSTCDQMRYHCI